MFKLRFYQENVDNDCKEFIHNSPYTRGFLVNPTGTGKSLIPSLIAKDIEGDCLVVQPNVNLLNQNVEKARAFGLDPSVYSASAKSRNISKLTYGTPGTLVKDPSLFNKFKTIVIDEMHYGMTNTLKGSKVHKKGVFNEFLDYLQPNKVIGMTATPIQLVNTGGAAQLKMVNRSKRSYWLGAELFHVTQISDICDDYWADIEIDNRNPHIEGLFMNSNRSELTDESIVRAYAESDSDSEILKAYDDLKQQGFKKTLIFVPTVAIGTALLSKNPDFELIHGLMSDSIKESIIKRFKEGEIKVLINVEMLTTGFDDPNVDSIILARETASLGLYYQIYGRLVRPYISSTGLILPKKAMIIDLTGNTDRFGDLRGLTFEKQTYTKGWGMWNNDRLLTGYPFGDWNMPFRKSLIREYDNQTFNAIEKVKRDVITFPFGKYNGVSVEHVFNKDRRYVVWFNENIGSKKAKNVKKEIERLLTKDLLHGE